ncbi:hypothetical protein BY996DRAFT_6460982 [Phakopsora pachyrhizi]|nr:hypothetical protein BY996DRAFT_6460982 [Phakopsora pachyrhizi]
MTRPTETTRRRLPKLHSVKPEEIDRHTIQRRDWGWVGSVGLEVALERRQVIGRRETETEGALEGPSKRTTTKGIEQGHGADTQTTDRISC